MAFIVPVMPLVCDIYTGPWLTKVLRLSGVACNLAWGKRVNTGLSPNTIAGSAYPQLFMQLLLPALTDIRDDAGLVSAQSDVVECPAGSGRWYGVECVDDIGKGFSNEHRGAILYKICERVSPSEYPGLAWPVPIP